MTLPPSPAPTSVAGGIEENGAATPHAESVRRAQSSSVQVMSGQKGAWHCWSRHCEGHPRLVLEMGGVRQRILFGIGGVCAPCPPGGGGRCGDGLTEAQHRSGVRRTHRGPTSGPVEGGRRRYVTSTPSVLPSHQGATGGSPSGKGLG